MSDGFSLRPLVIIDFETTGEDPSYHDTIEMGAIAVESQSLKILAMFEEKIHIQHPERCQAEALAVNGYNDAGWKNAVDLYDAILEFENFVEGRNGVLCAWNINFEIRLIVEAYGRLNRTNPFSTRRHSHKLDIPSMVWIRYPEIENLSYDPVAKFFGLEPEAHPHTAFGGALHNLSLLKKLRGIE